MADVSNEFDNIPDDFADIQGVDWATILAGSSVPAPNGEQETVPAPSRRADSQSDPIGDPSPPGFDGPFSSYFSDKDDDIDATFLAEVDRIEQRALAREVRSSTVGPSRAADECEFISFYEVYRFNE